MPLRRYSRTLVTGFLALNLLVYGQEDRRLLEVFTSSESQLKDLFGKTVEELKELLGEPVSFNPSEGMYFGNAQWQFADYCLDTDFHPVKKPRVNFFYLTPLDHNRSLEDVLDDLGLNEPNGKAYSCGQRYEVAGILCSGNGL